MRNHYLPQIYLKGFCRPSTEKICVYAKKDEPHLHCSNISKVGVMNNLYSEELEQFFATEIEGNALSLILKKIEKRISLLDDEKFAFSRFIVTLLRRGPTDLSLFQDYIRKAIDPECDQLLEQYPHSPEMQERIEKVRLKFKENPPKDIWYDTLQNNSTPNFLRAIFFMTWEFLTSDNEIFICSDNPFFFFKHEGIGKPYSEITFPVSTRTALLITWLGDRDIYRKASIAEIHQINRRTIANSIDYIYSDEAYSWIPSMCGQRKLDIHKFIYRKAQPTPMKDATRILILESLKARGENFLRN